MKSVRHSLIFHGQLQYSLLSVTLTSILVRQLRNYPLPSTLTGTICISGRMVGIEWSIVLGLGCPSLACDFYTNSHSSAVQSFFFHLTGKVYESVKAHLQEESCAEIERWEV